jgi:hypothetical protein
MLYKKQILERYNKMNDHKLQDEPPPKSNKFDNYDNCNQSRHKNKILKIYNSPLIDKKSILMKHKVRKPKLQYVELKDSDTDTMHWEIIEEITYSEFLYNKYKSKKCKLNNTYIEENKKSKKIKKSFISINEAFVKNDDVIINYDSDETETEDETNTHFV